MGDPTAIDPDRHLAHLGIDAVNGTFDTDPFAFDEFFAHGTCPIVALEVMRASLA